MSQATYSPNELKLFKHWELEYMVNMTIFPAIIWRTMAEKAFLSGASGPEVEAVRRGLIAINNANPYRLTDEFEELIAF